MSGPLPSVGFSLKTTYDRPHHLWWRSGVALHHCPARASPGATPGSPAASAHRSGGPPAPPRPRPPYAPTGTARPAPPPVDLRHAGLRRASMAHAPAVRHGPMTRQARRAALQPPPTATGLAAGHHPTTRTPLPPTTADPTDRRPPPHD